MPRPEGSWSAWVHADRAAGGDRDYRHLDRPACCRPCRRSARPPPAAPAQNNMKQMSARHRTTVDEHVPAACRRWPAYQLRRGVLRPAHVPHAAVHRAGERVTSCATPVTSGGVIPLWETPGQRRAPSTCGRPASRRTCARRTPPWPPTTATDWTPGEASYAANFQMPSVCPTRTRGRTCRPSRRHFPYANFDGNTQVHVSITDGQSNTIMFAEKLSACPGVTADRGSHCQAVHRQSAARRPRRSTCTNSAGGSAGGCGASTGPGRSPAPPPPTSTDSFPADRVSPLFGGVPGRRPTSTIWYAGPNSKSDASSSIPVEQQQLHLADHPHLRPRPAVQRRTAGVMNLGLGDGSVRTVSSSIDPYTWWAACHPQRRRDARVRNW